MPVMDGLEATRRIKADERGKETIVVVLTASALDDDRRAVSGSGADGFLTKPCREDELLEMMRARLNITYDYEEVSDGEGQFPTGAAALSSERLGQLPIALVEELRNAIVGGKKKRFDALIDQVRKTGDGGLADALKDLADKYEYDVLRESLEAACRR
jgi:CheY-like chemotaxis protein